MGERYLTSTRRPIFYPSGKISLTTNVIQKGKIYLTRILLDRNAISTIEKKLNGQNILQYRDRQLRLLDKPNNLISPLLSIQEGNIGLQMKDKEQIESLINIELNLLNNFFKKAKVDIALSKQKELFVNNFSEGMGTEKWNNYHNFLLDINALLHQQLQEERKIK